jgi:hypothetical protein
MFTIRPTEHTATCLAPHVNHVQAIRHESLFITLWNPQIYSQRNTSILIARQWKQRMLEEDIAVTRKCLTLELHLNPVITTSVYRKPRL